MSVKQTTTMMGGRRTLAVYMTKETERENERVLCLLLKPKETERSRKKKPGGLLEISIDVMTLQPKKRMRKERKKEVR